MQALRQPEERRRGAADAARRPGRALVRVRSHTELAARERGLREDDLGARRVAAAQPGARAVVLRVGLWIARRRQGARQSARAVVRGGVHSIRPAEGVVSRGRGGRRATRKRAGGAREASRARVGDEIDHVRSLGEAQDSVLQTIHSGRRARRAIDRGVQTDDARRRRRILSRGAVATRVR